MHQVYIYIYIYREREREKVEGEYRYLGYAIASFQVASLLFFNEYSLFRFLLLTIFMRQ